MRWTHTPAPNGCPPVALIIVSIARDDDRVSILENCKDHSAENARHCVPMLPCAVPCWRKKKDVRDREYDGIEEEVGPLFFIERGCAIVPIWRDSLDTVFRGIWRSWPMPILHIGIQRSCRRMAITLKVASWWSLVAVKLVHVWICIESSARGRNSRQSSDSSPIAVAMRFVNVSIESCVTQYHCEIYRSNLKS